jgi:hypothetical protein
VNFYSDLASIVKEDLSTKGYFVPANASDDEIVEGYLNVVYRQIPIKPRIVEESSELVCPPELVAGYSELKRKASVGEPLKGNQSRTINKPDYYDGLFIDWGIQHFHLGTASARDRFVQRTRPLLYARVTQERFYAIQVYDHGAWSKQEIVRILQRNWPEATNPFELKGIKPLGPPRSDQEIADFRKAGILSLVEAGGKLIAPMGGGFVSSGDGAAIIRSRGDLRSSCRQMEEQTQKIIADAAAHGHKLREDSIKLIKRDGNAVSIDESSNTPIAACEWFIRSELQ